MKVISFQHKCFKKDAEWQSFTEPLTDEEYKKVDGVAEYKIARFCMEKFEIPSGFFKELKIS